MFYYMLINLNEKYNWSQHIMMQCQKICMPVHIKKRKFKLLSHESHFMLLGYRHIIFLYSTTRKENI